MRATRRAAFALVTVAAFGLAACGGSDAVEEVAAPVPAAEPGPAEPDPPEDPDGTPEGDDYWSSDRLAALEEAKDGYVAPTPAAPADTAGDADAPAVEPSSGDPEAVATGETLPVEADRYRLDGHVDVPDHVWLREYSDEEPEDGDKCRRDQKGYEDVEAGTQITVSDGGGGTLAGGEVEAGTLTTSYEDKVGRAMDCRMPFTVEDVPVADSYTIGLADRGELTFTFDDMERQGWKVAFSIDW